jgi:dTDP-4-amino-4,6-dideoxygalactose transaminase
LIDGAEIVREKGTNRSRFFRGQVDKYTWVDVGSSYLLSDILAAFLYGQLEQREALQERRRRIWNEYFTELAEWAGRNGVQLPHVPSYCDHPYHMFYILMPTLNDRQRFIQYLKGHEVWSVYHYLPLHTSTMGKQFGSIPGDCPVTEAISDRLVRLPMYFELSQTEQAFIIKLIKDFRTATSSLPALKDSMTV